ncbi:CoA transferase [Leisingera daeponensis]|uniref:CoA transferase n=1 Tax=Leisingera daeponensis TaxID=405746 RepID=UPI001C938D9A|nr:CoA transferase [Leisingera daeponensis]MBY6058393.1 CoA transferase [Leisingera daeponensis]
MGALLNAHHVPAARVRYLEDSLQEPHYAARGVPQEVEGQRRTAASFAFGHGGPALDHGPRADGADSAAVLQELGIPPEEFEALNSRGVVA